MIKLQYFEDKLFYDYEFNNNGYNVFIDNYTVSN